MVKDLKTGECIRADHLLEDVMEKVNGAQIPRLPHNILTARSPITQRSHSYHASHTTFSLLAHLSHTILAILNTYCAYNEFTTRNFTMLTVTLSSCGHT